MSSVSLARRPVLADRIVPRSLVSDAALVVAGAALTAGLAQVAVPLWPVPITGQTLAVLLVGGTLGAVRGTLSMVL
ncbi:MAG: biotin transporter BioY, partial [Actinomycetota bacterium]|nr:biotin transporter BioY [Actinomycetota bacterium]